MTPSAVESVGEILARGGDADDVLRAVVAVLAAEPGITWAGISFLEDGELAPGPDAGVPDVRHRAQAPVVYQGVPVGELAVDGDTDNGALERVAELISAHVLLGWDTGGEAWDP